MLNSKTLRKSLLHLTLQQQMVDWVQNRATLYSFRLKLKEGPDKDAMFTLTKLVYFEEQRKRLQGARPAVSVSEKDTEYTCKDKKTVKLNGV